MRAINFCQLCSTNCKSCSFSVAPPSILKTAASTLSTSTGILMLAEMCMSTTFARTSIRSLTCSLQLLKQNCYGWRTTCGELTGKTQRSHLRFLSAAAQNLAWPVLVWVAQWVACWTACYARYNSVSTVWTAGTGSRTQISPSLRAMPTARKCMSSQCCASPWRL